MARTFEIPEYYRSPVVSTIKSARKVADQRKKDLAPTVLDLGKLKLKIARHFGFCFGVENAIEIAYRAIAENPGKQIYLLSEMIHNPHVNNDLLARGVKFILSTDDKELISFDALKKDDIVIVPAFGTTLELFSKLAARGVNPRLYDATCPFVEKVWKRAEQLGERGFTVIIHGKHTHEETRATFSHAKVNAPSLVVRDMQEARLLGEYLSKKREYTQFFTDFAGRASEGFEPEKDLVSIGVVNQTTMLASETYAISEFLRSVMLATYVESEIGNHFADTRDTLCYATNQNQDATQGLIESGGDLALVVGGYNSSNTSHLVELLEQRYPTFYIKDAEEIVDAITIRHLSLATHTVQTSAGWLPRDKSTLEVLLTAGASCPDALVDRVITKMATLMGVEELVQSAVSETVKQSLAM